MGEAGFDPGDARNLTLTPFSSLEAVGEVHPDEAVAPRRPDRIRLVDVEHGGRLQAQGPLVRETPAELDAHRPAAVVGVGHEGGGDLGALDVVEREAGGEEDVVLELVGRPPAPVVAVTSTKFLTTPT